MKEGELYMVTKEIPEDVIEKIYRNNPIYLPKKPWLRSIVDRVISEGVGAPEPDEYARWLSMCRNWLTNDVEVANNSPIP